jgi:glycerol-3-phosphate acyltransferase PlsY
VHTSIVAALIVAYLLGSVPTAYILGRVAKGIDIRDHGSGNVGSTNALRVLGKKLGIFCLVVDLLKGVAGVVIARWVLEGGALAWRQELVAGGASVTPEMLAGLTMRVAWWTAAAGLATILGHIFTIWLRFRGGKGVASTVGVFLALQPWALLAAAAVGVAIIWRTRFVALGSLVIAWLLPALTIAFGAILAPEAAASPRDWLSPLLPSTVLGLLLALMITWSHRGNISRLRAGTERRLGDAVGTAAEETGAARAAGDAASSDSAAPPVA